MFDQMKTAFRKLQSKEVTADASGGIVQREPSVESKPSTAVSVDLGDALLLAGAHAAPPVPTVDCCTFGAAEPVAEPVDPADARVIGLLVASTALVRNEIAGGLNLSRERVDGLLARLVAEGRVIRLEQDDHSVQYTVQKTTPVQPATTEPYISPEQRWSNEAAAKQRAADEALKPKPAPRYEPSAEEIQLVLDAEAERRKSIALSPEERKTIDLMTRNRVARNPQAYLKR
jgi:hypothetical protein